MDSHFHGNDNLPVLSFPRRPRNGFAQGGAGSIAAGDGCDPEANQSARRKSANLLRAYVGRSQAKLGSRAPRFSAPLGTWPVERAQNGRLHGGPRKVEQVPSLQAMDATLKRGERRAFCAGLLRACTGRSQASLVRGT